MIKLKKFYRYWNRHRTERYNDFKCCINKRYDKKKSNLKTSILNVIEISTNLNIFHQNTKARKLLLR